MRVVDFTAMLAGPFATMLLSDLGADVVKIESAEGDHSRSIGPLRADDDGSVALGGYFQSINRGKRSIVLNLKDASDREQALRLVRAADVVVENFTAGVMERLGLGYETLAAENPRLVYAAVRGFGDQRSGASPYETWPAFDIVAQAMGGFLGITGTADGVPVKSGPGVGDIFPGTLLALGILAAVRDAERTGAGQFVDVAMYDAVLALCERLVYQYSYLGEIPRPQGNGHPMLAPFDVLPTADGWVALAGSRDHHWRLVAEAVGRPELGTDPLFATNAERAGRAVQVRAIIGPWFAAHKTEEVIRLLGGRVPIGPVNDAAHIYADPHVKARQMLVEVEQPGSGQPVTVAGSPIKFSRTPSRVRRRAPMLGEDNVEAVLADWQSADQCGVPEP